MDWTLSQSQFQCFQCLILYNGLTDTSPQQADFRGVKKTSGDSVDLGLGLSLDKRNLSLASEKDLKTCANIDTKFQQVTFHPKTIKITMFRCTRSGVEAALKAQIATWSWTSSTRLVLPAVQCPLPSSHHLRIRFWLHKLLLSQTFC